MELTAPVTEPAASSIVSPVTQPLPVSLPTMEYQTILKRFLALLVDDVLIFVVSGFLVGSMTGGLTKSGFSLWGTR